MLNLHLLEPAFLSKWSAVITSNPVECLRAGHASSYSLYSPSFETHVYLEKDVLEHTPAQAPKGQMCS